MILQLQSAYEKREPTVQTEAESKSKCNITTNI